MIVLLAIIELGFGASAWVDAMVVSVFVAVCASTFVVLRRARRSFAASVASREELGIRLGQQEAVARLGQFALTGVPRQELLEEACRSVAAELRTDLAAVLELLPDLSAFVLRAGVGWPPEQLGVRRVPVGAHSQSGYTLASRRPVIMDDAAQERRFELSTLMALQGVTSGLTASIGWDNAPYGVLSAHTYGRREFSEQDATFLEAVANMLASALHQRDADDEAENTHRVLEAVIEGTTDNIFVKDLEGRFIAVNASAALTLRRPRQELIGRTLHEVLPTATADEMAETDRLILERGTVETFEESMPGCDEPCTFLTTKGPYRAHDGTLLGTFGIAHDITLRKAREQELRSARDYADRLIETSNAIVLVLDQDANIITFNTAAEEITGYTRQEVLGRNWDLLLPRDRYPEPWIEFARLGGEGVPQRFENPLLTKSGEERIILWQNSELHDQANEVVGTVSFGIDVTETVSAKQQTEQLERRLRQAEKLEAVGQLAGGVAHDFNNLLLGISGYGELALGRLARGEEGVADDIKGVLEAADRAAGLTRQLLAFARRQVLNPEVLDLNEVVQKTVDLLTRVLGDNIELVTRPAGVPVVVLADRGQLERVITNLAINGRDAMPNGGHLTIRVAIADLGPSVDNNEPRYALLSVTDEGSGIDAATASHIFEPFFTTKGEEGTGLGLATVHGIVAQSGGQIVLESEPGRGSTFSVHLPLSTLEPSSPAPASAAPAAGGAETILLVEDDPAVRSIVSALLAERGYRIIEAADGKTAIQQFETRKHPIQLVVSDLMMRGIDGRQTIDRIRAIEPDIKVLYMSGYTNDAIIRSGGLGPTTGFIEKPFSADELATHVRDLLDAATEPVLAS